jgi:hypothetical protein
MTSQVTNRREEVSTSCRGHSRKLCAFANIGAAQELLDELTIGGGSASRGVVVEGVKEVK